MAGNFLEDLVKEWLEFNGFLVKQNIPVDPRPNGGFNSELDVVGFHPVEKKVVHFEPSMDALSWEDREKRFSRKFEFGRKYIPKLFPGLTLPTKIEQYALLVFASKKNRSEIGGGKIMLISEFLSTIRKDIHGLKLESGIVPENLPMLRLLLFVDKHYREIFK